MSRDQLLDSIVRKLAFPLRVTKTVGNCSYIDIDRKRPCFNDTVLWLVRSEFYLRSIGK